MTRRYSLKCLHCSYKFTLLHYYCCCVYVHFIYIGRQVYMPEHMHAEPRVVFSSSFSLCLIPLSSWDPTISIPPMLGLQACTVMPGVFNVGAWDSNAGLRVCIADILTYWAISSTISYIFALKHYPLTMLLLWASKVCYLGEGVHIVAIWVWIMIYKCIHIW